MISAGRGPSPSASNHAKLVKRCLGGESDAWDEFIETFANLIYSTILRFDLPDDEVEETFQSSVVAMYERLLTLRESGKLVSWIVGIASRQSINRIRSRTREKRALQKKAASDPSKPRLEGVPEDELEKLEDAQMVQEGLASLGEPCRRLLTYLFLDDPPKSYDEIASLEDVPRGSIGPNRQRCLEKMRKVFERRGWLV